MVVKGHWGQLRGGKQPLSLLDKLTLIISQAHYIHQDGSLFSRCILCKSDSFLVCLQVVSSPLMLIGSILMFLWWFCSGRLPLAGNTRIMLSYSYFKFTICTCIKTIAILVAPQLIKVNLTLQMLLGMRIAVSYTMRTCVFNYRLISHINGVIRVGKQIVMEVNQLINKVISTRMRIV